MIGGARCKKKTPTLRRYKINLKIVALSSELTNSLKQVKPVLQTLYRT